MSAATVAVVGVHGYGARHVLDALALQRQGQARLVAVVDPRGGPVVRDGIVVSEADLPPRFPDLPAALAAVAPEVVVVATPLHTHAELAAQALAAGADVLLEKPPVTRREELHALLAAEASSRGRVQVGFQALGSAALPALAGAVARGDLGRVQRMGAWGSWSRDRAYFARAPWAGRRVLSGREVVDGTLTNPFAHAVADLLHLAGRTGAGDVGSVEVDLFHAHDIEADDTAAVRIGPVSTIVGTGSTAGFDGPLLGAFTLAGPVEALPVVEVVGDEATARLLYTEDRIEVTGHRQHGQHDQHGQHGQRAGGPSHLAGSYPRTALLADLLARRSDGGPLICPLAATGGFVEVAEAVRAAAPAPVDPRWVRWEGRGDAARPVILGVDEAIARVVRGEGLFRESGAPWA